MPAIRITVGAHLDANATHVFKPLIAAAEQARASIRGIGLKGAEEYVGGYRTAPARARKGFDEVAAAAKRADGETTKSGKKAADQRTRDMEHVFQVKMRYLAQEEAAEKASADKIAKAHSGAAKARASVVSKGVSGAVGAAKGAVGVAGEFARGAGIQTDLSGSVGRGVELHGKAADIVNQLRLNGKTPGAGEADDLVKRSRDVGNAKGIGANEVMGAFADFQAKSSDLDTAKVVMEDLAELAKATGTSFADMGAAAGNVNSQLAGDGPEKAKQLLAIMRLTTAQTAAGSVEMKDFASQMPKLSSAANQFGGDYAENLGQLTALAQMSIKGGAMNGSEAATAAGSIGRDINKGRTEKAWTAQGLSIYADKDKKNIKSPQQLIMESLDKTGGDRSKFGKLWSNSTSAKSANAALKVYNDAGGGKAGHAAVQGEFTKFKQTVSPEQVKAMAASKLDDTGAKVARFNNELDRIADSTAAKVLPALEKLAPRLIQAADSLGKMVGWAAENPAKAMALAFAASIAKEAASVGLKALLEKGLTSSMGGASGMTFAVAAATFIIGKSIIDDMIGGSAKAGDATRDTSVAAGNVESAQRGALRSGTVSQQDYDEAIKVERDLQAKIAAASTDETSSSKNPIRSLVGDAQGIVDFISPGSGKSFQTQREETSNLANIGELKEHLAAVQKGNSEMARQLASGTLKVMVMNPDAIGGGAKPGTTGPAPPVAP